jgi:hypothetical protein
MNSPHFSLPQFLSDNNKMRYVSQRVFYDVNMIIYSVETD